MSKKSNYWYVLVCTTHGAKFVTGIKPHNMAEWNENEKPLEMSKSMAQDIATGLCFNWFVAFAVCQPFEIDKQPYLYSNGHFEWIANKE